MFVAALLALTALLLQLTAVDRLRLPFGHPDLLVIVVVSVALVEGPVFGMVLGFAAGFVADLLSGHLLGRLAFVLTVAGYLIGLLHTDEDRGAVAPVFIVGATSLLVSLANTGVGALIGDPRPGTHALVQAALALAFYDALLTPFLFPAVRALLRRLTPERR